MSSERKSVPSASPHLAAVEYLRMSTEHQKYSIANQAAEIRDFANRNGFTIVDSYVDRGKSGLTLRGRPALSRLIRDILSGGIRASALLVYDVSRWGRFQDVDEAACYEFLCRQSGVAVHYCAEQFGADGSMSSYMLKSLKRSMAAEYSRELSRKVYCGQHRLATLGYHVGGKAGFGLRRVLIGPDGVQKRILQAGERKNLIADRVILAPGPTTEVHLVKAIYKMYTASGGRRPLNSIAQELNRRRTRPDGARQWSRAIVQNILTCPRYVGTIVWARTSKKLHQPMTRNAQDKWVVRPCAFAPIIDAETFASVQTMLARSHVRSVHWAALRASAGTLRAFRISGA